MTTSLSPLFSSLGLSSSTTTPIASSLPLSSPRPPIFFNFLGFPSPNSTNPFIFSHSLASERCFPVKRSTVSSRQMWLCGYMKRDQGMDSSKDNGVHVFGTDDEVLTQIPTQAQSIVEGSRSWQVSGYKPVTDADYLQELLTIQQGPRSIGFFGTQNMGFLHQELIEILSYAMVITKNHIYSSGASGTNEAVIRGALRAEKPELLTVILPQSLKRQSAESRELLSKVQNVIEKPHYDNLPLTEASRLCNHDILSRVQQVLCFAFHDSKLLMDTCQEARNLRKIVTLFYLD